MCLCVYKVRLAFCSVYLVVVWKICSGVVYVYGFSWILVSVCGAVFVVIIWALNCLLDEEYVMCISSPLVCYSDVGAGNI